MHMDTYCTDIASKSGPIVESDLHCACPSLERSESCSATTFDSASNGPVNASEHEEERHKRLARPTNLGNRAVRLDKPGAHQRSCHNNGHRLSERDLEGSWSLCLLGPNTEGFECRDRQPAPDFALAIRHSQIENQSSYG